MKPLTPEQLDTPSYVSYRYLMFEVDGRVLFGGWQQRPKALASAERSGFGVYDSKEKVVIVQPDGAKRLEAAERRARNAREEAEEAEAELASIREAVKE